MISSGHHLCFIILGALLLSQHVARGTTHESESFKECIKQPGQAVFEVLPGNGWDSLRNIELGRVLALNYSRCSTTENGKFIVPNDLTILHTLLTQMDLASDVFTHYKDFIPVDAESLVNSARSLYAAAGSFSRDYLETKKTMLNALKDSTRGELEIRRLYMDYKFYSVNVLRGQALPLSKELKERLHELASELMVAPLKKPSYADYLAEMIVQQFGTHYIYGLDVGAVLSKTDFMIKPLKQEDLSLSFFRIDYTVCASLAFMTHFKTVISGIGYCSTSGLERFKKILFSSKTTVLGGPPMSPDSNVTEWLSKIEKNYAALDRRGDFLDTVLKKSVLPEYPEPIVREMQKRIREAIMRYYERNTVKGCMKFNHDGFNSNANVQDDSLCATTAKDYSLGGVYQTCSVLPVSKEEDDIRTMENLGNPCAKLASANPATGGYSCPKHGVNILLLEGVVHVCHANCERGEVSSCNRVCLKLHLRSFWCAMPTGNVSSMHFGGMHSQDPQVPNPLTHDYTCPVDFRSHVFGSASSAICLAPLNSEIGQKMQTGFGGMYSCIASNPMGSKGYPCPPGFTSHLGMVQQGCEVYYCMRTKELAELDPVEIKLPPYTHISAPSGNTLEINEVSMGTIDIGDGQQWMMVHGSWKLSKDVTLKEIQNNTVS